MIMYSMNYKTRKFSHESVLIRVSFILDTCLYFVQQLIDALISTKKIQILSNFSRNLLVTHLQTGKYNRYRNIIFNVQLALCELNV